MRAPALLAAAFAAAIPLAAMTVVGTAQERPAGRYAIAPTAEGYLKLDTRTGEVTECRREAASSRCSVVPDERAALQDEIDRLARENAALKAALAGTGGRLPGPAPAPEAAPGPGTADPSEKEVDRALSLMERVLRRFMAVMREDQAPQNAP